MSIVSSENFGGIDASFTGLACCSISDSMHRIEVFHTKPKDFESQEDRLIFLRNSVMGFFSICNPRLIAIEGYAFGSKFGRELAGELGGVLKVELRENRYPFVIVSPTSLKLWVTGKGNSDKNIMLREVYKKWGFEAEDDNANDAFALANLAKALFEPNVSKKLRELTKKFSFVK